MSQIRFQLPFSNWFLDWRWIESILIYFRIGWKTRKTMEKAGKTRGRTIFLTSGRFTPAISKIYDFVEKRKIRVTGQGLIGNMLSSSNIQKILILAAKPSSRTGKNCIEYWDFWSYWFNSSRSRPNNKNLGGIGKLFILVQRKKKNVHSGGQGPAMVNKF